MFPTVVLRAVTLVFGYMYPGYQCSKALRKRRPETRELIFWCRYWVLLAAFTAAEFLLDPFFSWLPMYPEAKLALVIFFWHPHTLGADYVYDRFLLPLLARHETVIDQHLKEAQLQVQGAAMHLWQQAYMQAQVQFLDLVSYLSALSNEAARQASMERNRAQLREVVDVDEPEYTFIQREERSNHEDVRGRAAPEVEYPPQMSQASRANLSSNVQQQPPPSHSPEQVSRQAQADDRPLQDRTNGNSTPVTRRRSNRKAVPVQ